MINSWLHNRITHIRNIHLLISFLLRLFVSLFTDLFTQGEQVNVSSPRASIPWLELEKAAFSRRGRSADQFLP